MRELERTGSDIAACGYVTEYNQRFTVRKAQEAYTPYIIEGNEKCLRSISAKEHCSAGFMWNKIYRRELLDGIEFDPNKTICDDLFFTLNVMARCEKLVLVELPMYHYRNVSGSLSHQPNIKRMQNCLRSYEEIEEWCKTHAPICTDGVVESYIFWNTKVCETMLHAYDDETYRIVRANLQRVEPHIKDCGLRVRTLARCLLHSWGLYRIVGGAVWQAKKVYIWGKNIHTR